MREAFRTKLHRFEFSNYTLRITVISLATGFNIHKVFHFGPPYEKYVTLKGQRKSGTFGYKSKGREIYLVVWCGLVFIFVFLRGVQSIWIE